MQTITRRPFGSTLKGEVPFLYTLANHKGVQIAVTDFGATLVSIKTPDRNGNMDDIVLGFDSVEGYENPTHDAYIGATIGRFANRIDQGRFTLNGKTFQIPINNPPNSLHGGKIGFDRCIWQSRIITPPNGIGIEFTHTSPNGDQSFPGELTVKAYYLLTEENEVQVHYQACAKATTIINLTNHTYFNLSGRSDILDHQLQINASHYTPVNSRLIPTGEILPLDNTPLDFRHPHLIGERIHEKHPQLQTANGYDHNYVLNIDARDAINADGRAPLQHALTLSDRNSGRIMELYCTAPGLQCYSGNFLNNLTGKYGKNYGPHAGIAFEPQNFPDAPNHPGFPSAILHPGENYHQSIHLRFPSAK